MSRAHPPAGRIKGCSRGWVACALALTLLGLDVGRAAADEIAEDKAPSATDIGPAIPRSSSPSEVAIGPEATDVDGPVYRIGRFGVQYVAPEPDNPDLSGILPVQVELERTPTGYVRPRAGHITEEVWITGETQPSAEFHASAIAAISQRVLVSAHELGLMGIYVVPDPTQIDGDTEQDLRPPSDNELRFVVWTGRIKEVRTVAIGDRIRDNWKINNPKHRTITSKSPFQSVDLGQPDTTDLLDRDTLENFLFRLNRHPGRYVEAALSASEDKKGIALDYRVHESRPWSVYAQVSNTGTKRTNPWQTRVGLIHRQLTGRDDILSLEYLNSGFDDVHGVMGSYEAPWFRKQRPDWARTSGSEPAWIAWANRDKVPWWGTDRLRWRIAGGWTRIETGLGELSNFETDRVLINDWSVGGELIYNALQQRAYFLDTFLGFRYRNVTNDNLSLNNFGESQMLIGDIGVRMERVNEYSSLFGRFAAEFTGADSSFRSANANLGRPNTDDWWPLLRWDFSFTHFMEPLFNPSAWKDPSTPRSSTLAHEVAFTTRGQYAFDFRLIPEASQVIGGLYTVRGFRQSIAAGDSVYLGSLEYRFHLPRVLPLRRKPMDIPLLGDFRLAPQQVYGRPDWDLIFRAFVDTGYSVYNERDKGINEFNQTLVSAGVGAEFRYRGNLRIRVDWGRGLVQKPVDKIKKSGEVYFLFSILY